jgi:hypothetical protein
LHDINVGLAGDKLIAERAITVPRGPLPAYRIAYLHEQGLSEARQGLRLTWEKGVIGALEKSKAGLRLYDLRPLLMAGCDGRMRGVATVVR